MKLSNLVIIAFILAAIALPVLGDHHTSERQKLQQNLKKDIAGHLNEDYVKAKRDLEAMKEKLRQPLQDAAQQLKADRDAFVHGVKHAEADHAVVEPDTVHEQVEETLSAAGYAAGVAKENLKDLGTEIKDNVKQKVHSAADAVRSTASKAGDRVADEVHDVTDKLKDAAHNVNEKVNAAAKKVNDKLGEGVEKKAERIRETVADLKDRTEATAEQVKGNLKNTAAAAQSAVKDAADNAKQGVKDAAYNTKEMVKDAAYNMKEGVKDAAYSAKETVEDVKERVKANAAEAARKTESLRDKARDTMQMEPAHHETVRDSGMLKSDQREGIERLPERRAGQGAESMWEYLKTFFHALNPFTPEPAPRRRA